MTDAFITIDGYQQRVADLGHIFRLLRADGRMLVVRNGPFAGLVYPGFQSAGSVLLPKLLGSYESELNAVISEVIDTAYPTILNIGSGEGYYAVGLAVRSVHSFVCAYDIDPKARELCRQMAAINGVTDRVVVEPAIDEIGLSQFRFSSRSLIIADCEGEERMLFTPKSAANLAGTDLLIEAHDFEGDVISERLPLLFRSSHEVRVIECLSDDQKVATYCFAPFAVDCPPEIRALAYSEYRAERTKWLWLKALERNPTF